MAERNEQPRISRKAREVKPFFVMEILERAQELEREGRDIIHLEVGEPDFPTPKAVCEAAMVALADGKTCYTHSLGLIELREAIAENFKTRYDVDVSPGQIVVTSGTSPAMSLIFSTILSPGDEVLLTDPHYACYPNFVRAADGVPRFVPVKEEDGFQLTVEQIERNVDSKVAAIMINSPANPTGTLIPDEVMRKIAGTDSLVVSDEIYHGLVYGEREHTILEYTDRAFVVNGFSKLFAMTGWRIGYIIAPPEYVRTLQNLHQNFHISANCFVQWAAITALRETGEEVRHMVRIYDERRRYIVKALRELGLSVKTEPKGAFYVLAGVSHISGDSMSLAHEILEKAGVAVTPGIDFGSGGEGYIRFTYANSLDNIREGVRRLGEFLRSYKK